MNSITKNSPNNNKNIAKHKNNLTKKKPSSFSSSSSSSSSFSSNHSSNSLNYSSSQDEDFSNGIPFSWETIPGIPKKQQNLIKTDSFKKLPPHGSKNYLPLPPAVASSAKNFNQKKHYITTRDPFFAALVECSKPDDADENYNTMMGRRSIVKPNSNNNKSLLGMRFGFGNMSCKNVSNSCVSQSLVFVPRGAPKRISYDVLNNKVGHK